MYYSPFNCMIVILFLEKKMKKRKEYKRIKEKERKLTWIPIFYWLGETLRGCRRNLRQSRQPVQSQASLLPMANPELHEEPSARHRHSTVALVEKVSGKEKTHTNKRLSKNVRTLAQVCSNTTCPRTLTSCVALIVTITPSSITNNTSGHFSLESKVTTSL